MATIATVYNRFLRPMAETAGGERTAEVADNQFALRPIPNEDLYLYIKDFDNGRVVRQADPQAPGNCWRLILSGGLAVLLLIGVLLPSAAGRIAGYQIQALMREQVQLRADKAALEVEEARELSPRRINEIAQEQKFLDPASRQYIVYLPGKSGSLAMVKK
jgi:hypothetical protein